MAGDTSLGTVPPYRQRSLPAPRGDPEWSAGRPIPAVRRTPTELDRPRSRTAAAPRSENSGLAASFPLLFFGGGCVAVAAFVLLGGSGASIGRIPLWIPFLALGIIALVGGGLAVFAEPDEEPTEAPEGPGSRPQYSPLPRPVPPRRPSPPREARADGGRPTAPNPRPLSNTPPSSAPVQREPPPATPRPPATPSAAPLPPGGPVSEDASSLLREIDLIEADLHASRAARRAATPFHPVDGSIVVETNGPEAPRRAPAPRPGNAPGRPESGSPPMVAHCIGCGSAILHARAPSQCQLCGGPLCSECRDRSLTEGKPNLCPLCGLLDSVHPKGSPTATATGFQK